MKHQLIIGFILGIIFFEFFSDKNEGERPERSLRFLIGNYYIHIHHWLISCILILILSFLKIFNFFIIGLLFGALIQGLSYRDWYYIIYHKDNYKKIYTAFKKDKQKKY